MLLRFLYYYRFNWIHLLIFNVQFLQSTFREKWSIVVCPAEIIIITSQIFRHSETHNSACKRCTGIHFGGADENDCSHQQLFGHRVWLSSRYVFPFAPFQFVGRVHYSEICRRLDFTLKSFTIIPRATATI